MNFYLPGDNSDTGVLDGVGLCPGGRKCEGDPLLEPLLPCPPVKSTEFISLHSECAVNLILIQ